MSIDAERGQASLHPEAKIVMHGVADWGRFAAHSLVFPQGRNTIKTINIISISMI